MMSSLVPSALLREGFFFLFFANTYTAGAESVGGHTRRRLTLNRLPSMVQVEYDLLLRR